LPPHPGTSEARLEIFYFDAGGGHRNAMTALSALIAKEKPGWQVTAVDLQALLEPVDPVYRLTRRVTGSLKRLLRPVAPSLSVIEPWQAQDIYNSALKRGVTTGMGAILPVLQRFIARYATDIEALLAKRWKDPATPRPDLVVSVIPNFNWVLFGALRRALPHVPYATVITDFADCPPHFWMEDQDQIMICGTDIAYRQAVTSGFYRPADIHLVSGMILKDNFYAAAPADAPARADLGLSEDGPVALIMFGGNGSSSATNAILAQLEKTGLGIEAIVMCGRNATLFNALEGRPGVRPIGFVNNVADYMRLADFFIGKPGPGSLAEALHMGLPVIVEKNSNTMPQERPNPDWVQEKGVGVVISSFRKDTGQAARQVLGSLKHLQDNIRENVPANRAVFEVVTILERYLGSAGHMVASAQATSSPET
jgi:1,2-diacylglycerol 3-beta-galactosyltransferase